MVDPIDRYPQGDPETVVLLPHGALVGLHILHSGHGQIMLGIREDAQGQPVSCAVTNELVIEYPPQRGHPRRYGDREDGA